MDIGKKREEVEEENGYKRKKVERWDMEKKKIGYEKDGENWKDELHGWPGWYGYC